MTPTANPRVLYAKIPGDGLPVIGEHIVFDPTPTIDLDLPLNGGYLTKTLLLSPEPYMRERLRDPSITSYSTPMKVGQPLVASALVVVLRSEKEGVKPGDHMFGMTPWEVYTVQPYMDGAFPWTKYCNILGNPGLTAFFTTPYKDVSNLTFSKGETIYVSSGASGVGSMAIQLCKLKGLRVIASASTDDKVAYMRSLGADVAFNYKTTSVAQALGTHGPIDLYFDNVGGEQLEAALENMNMNGRVVCCGTISEYNTPYKQRHGIKNMGLVFKRRIRLQGFIVMDTPEGAARFFKEIPPLVAQGTITGEEHLFHGIESAPRAFLSLFDGTATAKPVVVVDPDYGPQAL
ncbi:hypothetical protein GGX14DRAFT_508609 [Mycena pura]|uniref:Enoyl reductase (ER) domain-containing protein n=1 Tax=Mycena pura TaxID=153505 RepID=A0AAD6YSG8_9AGAR|nr:hypothetical protein GGX14DRAFT_508609 [Mycena pura]